MKLSAIKKPPLTKEQKFDLNIIYRPMFFSVFGRKSLGEFTLEQLDKDDKKFLDCLSERTSLVFAGNSEDLYQFLDEYKENLNWLKVLKNLHYEVKISYLDDKQDNVTLNKILPRYSQYFNKSCWNYVTQKIYHGNENIIREYKDKLNWNHLSKNYNFKLEFMKEFADYVNIKHFIHRNNYYVNSLVTKRKLFNYLAKHIREVE